jgi:hypothetical protein
MRIREVEAEAGERPAHRAAEHASLAAQNRPQRAARVACHIVAELPFLVLAVVQIAQGWRATSDYAVMSIRSWAVFTTRTPLLGQISQATSCAGHTAFSPGPLQYWMLALPVRIDMAHGVLWGSALWCALGMLVCVEAAWAVRGATGAVAVGVFAVVLAVTQPAVFVKPMWNPYFGVVWFAATCMVAWAVARGWLWWWPLLVLTASIAAQSHLDYALPAALLAIVAPLLAARLRRGAHRGKRSFARTGVDVGGEERPVSWTGAEPGWRWIPVGLAVGAACWVTPLVQELTGRPGNLSVLARCVGGHRAMGYRLGLGRLASAVLPGPVWFHRQPVSAYALVQGLASHSEGAGTAVLVLLAVVTVVAWITRRGDLAVIGAVALVAAVSTVWEIAHQPVTSTAQLGYVDVVLWPVGMLVWGVAALTVAEALGMASAKWRGLRSGPVERARPGAARGPGHVAGAGWNVRGALLWGATSVLLVCGAVNAVFLGSRATYQAAQEVGGRGSFGAVTAAAAAAERAVPRGPFVISVEAPTATTSYALLYGTLWVLIGHGHEATAPGIFAGPIDPPARAVHGEPFVTVTVRAGGKVSGVVVTR